MYFENRDKIRRFIRDPEGKIWGDDVLLNLWNDEQRLFSREHNFLETPSVLKVPPSFHFTYLHEWEHGHIDHKTGHVYKAWFRNWQTPLVCSFPWESQEIGQGTGSEVEAGYQFCHPWEAYLVAVPAMAPPMWWPHDFHSVVFMAYRYKPVEFVSWKEMISRDGLYHTSTGEPFAFTIKDDVSNEWYLYPRPHGEDLFEDGDSYYGVMVEEEDAGFPYVFPIIFGGASQVLDYSAAETTQDTGAPVGVSRPRLDLLLVYRNRLADIEATTDDPGLPRFLQKYIEYGVIANAYRANTDGKIGSLADYWEWRKEIGREALRRFKFKRFDDRDFRLSSGVSSNRRSRGPKLPSTYPAVR